MMESLKEPGVDLGKAIPNRVFPTQAVVRQSFVETLDFTRLMLNGNNNIDFGLIIFKFREIIV